MPDRWSFVPLGETILVYDRSRPLGVEEYGRGVSGVIHCSTPTEAAILAGTIEGALAAPSTTEGEGT